MKINTTKFGPIQVDERKIIHFPDGLLGFESVKRYVLLHNTEDPIFWWLQSVDQPDIAFVVTNPLLFFPTYEIDTRENDETASSDFDDVVPLVILTFRRSKDGRTRVTANLMAPLILNEKKMVAVQNVISNDTYTVNEPISVPIKGEDKGQYPKKATCSQPATSENAVV